MMNFPNQETWQLEKSSKHHISWFLGGMATGALLSCGLLLLALTIGLPQRFIPINFPPRHGMKVVFHAQTGTANPISKDMQQAIKILMERAKSYGIETYSIQLSGEDRITVLLPKDDHLEENIKNLSQIGLIEFVDMGDDCLGDGTEIITDFSPYSPPSTAGKIRHTIFSGEQIQLARVEQDPPGNYIVRIELDENGKNTLAEYSKNNKGKCLAITLDKKIIIDPRIDSPIPEGVVSIEGDFSEDKAKNIATMIQDRALPFALEIVETGGY